MKAYCKSFRLSGCTGLLLFFALSAGIVLPGSLFAQNAEETGPPVTESVPAVEAAPAPQESPSVTPTDVPNVVVEDGKVYYIVQKGDTLWDISQKLLDSAWYWPELWKANTEVPITNPHLIYPGQRLRLSWRDGRDMVAEPEEIPPPEPMAPMPVPEEVPPPAPPPVEEPDYFVYSSINQVGFIRKEAVPPSGIIFLIKEEKEMISTGDLVYIRERGDEPLILGKVYTIYRTSEPMRDSETNEYVGIQHLLIGQVEITHNRGDYAIGQIVRSYRTIRKNDLLMPFEELSPNITLAETIKSLQGKILTSENRSTMMAEYDVAFIDKGEVHGVSPGQQYSIIDQDIRKLDQETQERFMIDPSEIGRIMVLLTQPTTSTVVITKSLSSIEPGTRFTGEVIQ